jgi:hypothetical protein
MEKLAATRKKFADRNNSDRSDKGIRIKIMARMAHEITNLMNTRKNLRFFLTPSSLAARYCDITIQGK